MDVKDFDFLLPEELIAQTPIQNRSESRLLVFHRGKKTIEHQHFYDILDYLTPNDVLVLNNTKVMPSRLYGHKTDTNALIECLLLKEVKEDEYEALVKPARRIKVGTVIDFNGVMHAVVTQKMDDGLCYLRFTYQGIFLERLEELGEMPLPPYIHERLADKNRYQTVYASIVGSAAAPTAGFHFTKSLLEAIQKKGVTIVYVTLHVGLGTFRPVSVATVEQHVMHHESYSMDEATANVLNQAKASHRRIISVGTTSTRTLEAIYKKYRRFVATSEETDIFIYPGYQFEAIDALITNFHLPKSTLLMLVSAFASREDMLRCYQEAIHQRYRFFSFGDAMFIQ